MRKLKEKKTPCKIFFHPLMHIWYCECKSKVVFKLTQLKVLKYKNSFIKNKLSLISTKILSKQGSSQASSYLQTENFGYIMIKLFLYDAIPDALSESESPDLALQLSENLISIKDSNKLV